MARMATLENVVVNSLLEHAGMASSRLRVIHDQRERIAELRRDLTKAFDVIKLKDETIAQEKNNALSWGIIHERDQAHIKALKEELVGLRDKLAKATSRRARR